MNKKLLQICAVIMVISLLLAGCSSQSSGNSAAANNTADNAAAAPAADDTPVDDVAPADDAAADWPSKTITLIVANKAGSSTDIMCRLLADALSKELGQTVVVENREGSSGWNAWNYLLHNAPKDGYTFGSINMNIVFGEYDESNPREDGLDDFTLLANQVADIGGIAIAPDETRFSTLEEMIEYSKTETLYTAAQATGITNGDSATLEWLHKNYGCQIEIVPVDSTSDSVAMFRGGNIDFLIASVSDLYAPTKNGEMNTLCLFSDERSALMPDTPTAKEQGIDYVSFSARGYAYPAGVDQAIVDKMTGAIEKVISDPDIIDQLLSMGQETMLLVGDDYKQVMEDELTKRLDVFGVERK